MYLLKNLGEYKLLNAEDIKFPWGSLIGMGNKMR